MPPIPSATFRKRLRGLDRMSFIAFVSELWAAQGYTIERDGSILIVDDGTDRERIWIHHRPRLSVRTVTPPSTSVDIVVSNRSGGPNRMPPGDPDVLMPAELRNRALYAIDRGHRKRLFDHYLGHPPVVDSPTSDRRPPQRTIITGLLVGVMVVALFGGGWIQGDIATLSRDGGRAVTTVDPTIFRELNPPVTTPTDRPRDHGTSTATAISADADLPSGLARTGIVDSRELAQRHAQHITERSYTLELIYREIDARQVSGSMREVATVQRPTVYTSQVYQIESPALPPPIIAKTAAYANGTVLVTRDAPNDPQPIDRLPGGEGPYADRVETYLEWYLHVDQSGIVDREQQDNRSLYWIRLGENPRPDMENAFGRALIDDRGIVHYLSVTYDVPDSSMQIVIAIHYTQIGGVSVEPPAWYLQNNRSTNVTEGCSVTGCSDAIGHPDGRQSVSISLSP